MTDLHWAGLLCAALLAAFGLWGWLARRPRLRAFRRRGFASDGTRDAAVV